MTKYADPKSGPLNILVVDDEANIRKTLAVCLEARRHRVTAVGSHKDALEVAALQVFDLAFVDLRLGTESGMDLISLLLAACPGIKIVVITAYASVDTAVEAIRRGATDYIPKPFKPDQVALVTERIATLHAMEQRISRLQEDLERVHPDILFKSAHPGMHRAIEMARQVAPSEAVVMLRGPSGTGKSVLARAIHGWSHRASKPLGIISCPTLSPELLESELFGHVRGAFTGALRDNPGRVAACEGGTLFLDEIGDLPLPIQSKLLRFIQDREYERVGDPRTRKADVRILAATNAELENAVRDGRFREDLFYRLNVIQIEIPPLRDRPDDTELLAKTMLGFFGAQNHKAFRGFSDDALRALRDYPWPGNIRELRNVIERAAILCPGDVIGLENLPESVSPHRPPIQLGDRVPLSAIEENHIRRVLATTKSLQEAAEVLGIDQATLWRKRKQLGI
jgi:two-component system, NtrC family, response regulator AlgB